LHIKLVAKMGANNVPIFESDEKATDKEFRRQQLALNDKVLRLSWNRMVDEQEEQPDGEFEAGDCWETEEDKPEPKPN